jgi:hypothetical protein
MVYTPGLSPVLGSNVAGYYTDATSPALTNFASQPTAAGTGAATYGAAGIGAAGQAVSTIAQIMANSAQRENQLQIGNDNRAGSERLAKMQIAAAAEMADKARAQQAQQFLIQTLLKNAQTPGRAQDLKRANNHTGASLIAQAFGT